MSLAVMGVVWDSLVPGNLKLPLLALADWANDAGVTIYAAKGHEGLANRCSVDDRTIRRSIARLRRLGLLDEEPRTDPRAARVYKVNIEVVRKFQPDRLSALKQSVQPDIPVLSNRTSECSQPDIRGIPSLLLTNNQRAPEEPPALRAARADPSVEIIRAEPEPLTAEIVDLPSINGGKVVAAYIDEYRAAHDGADPLDTGRLAKFVGSALRGRNGPSVVLQAAQAAAVDEFGAAAFPKHLARLSATRAQPAAEPKGFAGIREYNRRRDHGTGPDDRGDGVPQRVLPEAGG